jgi:hypothetical protein
MVIRTINASGFQFDTIAKDGREFYETIAMPVNAFPKKILIALK